MTARRDAGRPRTFLIGLIEYDGLLLASKDHLLLPGNGRREVGRSGEIMSFNANLTLAIKIDSVSFLLVLLLVLLLLQQCHNRRSCSIVNRLGKGEAKEGKKEEKNHYPGHRLAYLGSHHKSGPREIRSHSSHAFFLSLSLFRFYFLLFWTCHVCRRSA